MAPHVAADSANALRMKPCGKTDLSPARVLTFWKLTNGVLPYGAGYLVRNYNPPNLVAVVICAGFVGSPVHDWSEIVKALASRDEVDK